MQTVPATCVLGPGKTGLTIGLRVLNLDGTTYAAFSTTGVAETSTAGTYRKAGGVVAPLAGGYIVWGTAGTDYAEATVESAAANVTFWKGVEPASLTADSYVQSRVLSIADDAITAAAIAADAIGASELAADAVAEIWSYTTRTLTQSSTSTTDSTAAGSISRRRGDSWSISLTLGAITGYTSLWFTVKAATSDPDTAAIFQIKKNASGSGDGLLYVNGATASSAALGSITVSDASTGAIIVALDETITDDLTPASYSYDCQALISGSISTPDSGTFTVTADVTRAVT